MRMTVVAILFTSLALCSCSQQAAVSNSSPSPALSPTQAVAVATATPSFTLCNGTFALCTKAKCLPVPGTKEKVNCKCEVKHGYSAGTKPCDTVPPEPPKANEAIPSRYFPISSMAVCSIDAPWAFCLDKPCTVDDKDPHKANCLCDVKRTPEQSYVVVAGTKDDAMCTDALWSSATVQDVIGVTGFLYTQPQLQPSPITIVRVETAKK